LDIQMKDYAEYALSVKKREKEIYDLVQKRKYKEAEALAGELLIDVRQMWIWLIHAQESNNEPIGNVGFRDVL
jgi:hypothetical protein